MSELMISDLDLMARVVERDRAAFECLYLRYRTRLRGYLVRLLGATGLADDVLEDTMFVVWTDAARFSGQSRVSTWIFGIAHNKAMKVRRSLARRGTEVPANDEVLAAGEERSLGTAAREIRWAIDKALSVLTPEHRAVVELTYFHDCSYPEVAEIVGCPVNTVKTRMFHARRRLRPALEELGIGPPSGGDLFGG